MPGKEATFLVGGQIPIPVSNGLGTVSIVYKDYGVNLDVTPSLLGDGSVETKINPEISDLDFGNGIQLNGFVVPALKTSKLSTDVITKDGESIVMGGLLRRIETKNLTKIPVLSDIPGPRKALHVDRVPNVEHGRGLRDDADRRHEVTGALVRRQPRRYVARG